LSRTKNNDRGLVLALMALLLVILAYGYAGEVERKEESERIIQSVNRAEVMQWYTHSEIGE